MVRAELSLPPIEVVIGPLPKGNLGRAMYRARKLIVHEGMTPEQMLDTLKHELAHFMAFDLDGHRGHGWIWRMHAKALSCDVHAIQRSPVSAFREEYTAARRGQ